jgi:hypothetical protein
VDIHLYYENGKHYRISDISKYQLTVEKTAVSDEEHAGMDAEADNSRIHCSFKGEFKKILKRDPYSNYNTCVLDLPEEQARILAQTILKVLDDESNEAKMSYIDEEKTPVSQHRAGDEVIVVSETVPSYPA